MTSEKDWPSYWKNRWINKETGWHQTETEPGMVSFFSDLTPRRVLVPLCGKSLDLLWLLEKGHEVIGIELSELACEEFFNENKLPFDRVKTPDSIEYRGNRITIFNQDVFSIKPNHLGRIDAVYDRAALIALPPELRIKYTSHLISLLSKCSDSSLDFCQIVLEKVPSDLEGPPFSVELNELKKLYENSFEIETISKEFVFDKESSKVYECIYRLKNK